MGQDSCRIQPGSAPCTVSSPAAQTDQCYHVVLKAAVALALTVNRWLLAAGYTTCTHRDVDGAVQVHGDAMMLARIVCGPVNTSSVIMKLLWSRSLAANSKEIMQP